MKEAKQLLNLVSTLEMSVRYGTLFVGFRSYGMDEMEVIIYHNGYRSFKVSSQWNSLTGENTYHFEPFDPDLSLNKAIEIVTSQLNQIEEILKVTNEQ